MLAPSSVDLSEEGFDEEVDEAVDEMSWAIKVDVVLTVDLRAARSCATLSEASGMVLLFDLC